MLEDVSVTKTLFREFSSRLLMQYVTCIYASIQQSACTIAVVYLCNSDGENMPTHEKLCFRIMITLLSTDIYEYLVCYLIRYNGLPVL